MDPSLYPRGLQFNLPPTPAAPQSGGMFGGGGKFGIGQAIIAALNGYLASQPGGAGDVGRNNLQTMAALKQRQLQRQQELDDYSRRRADDNADFQSHRQYEINNPLPQQPGEFEQALIASGVQPGTPQWTQAMQARVTNTVDPVVMTPQGPMLRSQLLGGSVAGQPAPPGVTFTPVDPGGPTPSASGGFLGAGY